MREILAVGDLRSVAGVKRIISLICTREDFNLLFDCLSDPQRVVVMRAADAIEKITREQPEFLAGHEEAVMEMLKRAVDKELKWHLALLIPRLKLSDHQWVIGWDTLSRWALARAESRIVRVNSLQGLFELAGKKDEFQRELGLIFEQVYEENIPSVNARIRRLEKNLKKQKDNEGKTRR